MIAAAAKTTTVQPEQIMTLYEMLTVYRVRCGSFRGRGWVAWCFVSRKMVEAEGATPIAAVENLLQQLGGINGS